MDPAVWRAADAGGLGLSRARARGHDWRVVRYHGGDWPNLVTVRVRFGSLGKAVAAAGVRPPTRWEPDEKAVKRRLANVCHIVAQDMEPSRAGARVFSQPPCAVSLRRERRPTG